MSGTPKEARGDDLTSLWRGLARRDRSAPPQPPPLFFAPPSQIYGRKLPTPPQPEPFWETFIAFLFHHTLFSPEPTTNTTSIT